MRTSSRPPAILEGRRRGGRCPRRDRRAGQPIATLENDLEAAKQDVLYARAETQNVRRRLEKDIADARAYASTSFARDILSVADNLSRALDSISQELRDDEKLKPLVAGIEATTRELDKVFNQNAIQKVAAQGLPLDPNQHQAMIEIPTPRPSPARSFRSCSTATRSRTACCARPWSPWPRSR
jgi:molecular chaperone GrpE